MFSYEDMQSEFMTGSRAEYRLTHETNTRPVVVVHGPAVRMVLILLDTDINLEGRKITLIKAIRQGFPALGLKEAKEAVDAAYDIFAARKAQQDNEEKARIEGQFQRTGRDW